MNYTFKELCLVISRCNTVKELAYAGMAIKMIGTQMPLVKYQAVAQIFINKRKELVTCQK